MKYKDIIKLGNHMTSILYYDANENEYPVTVNMNRFSSMETLKMKLDLAGLWSNDTIGVQIRDNFADLYKGDPIKDANAITYACCDANGNVVLRGCGG